MTDDHAFHAARPLFLGGKTSPDQLRKTQQLEISMGDFISRELLRACGAVIFVLEKGRERDVLEAAVLRPIFIKFSRGQRGLRRLWAPGVNLDQPLRLAIR